MAEDVTGYLVSRGTKVELQRLIAETAGTTGGATRGSGVRQITHIKVTGTQDSQGFYPCVPVAYTPLDGTWSEFDGALAFSPNNAPLANNHYYIAVRYGLDANDNWIYATTDCTCSSTIVDDCLLCQGFTIPQILYVTRISGCGVPPCSMPIPLGYAPSPAGFWFHANDCLSIVPPGGSIGPNCVCDHYIKIYCAGANKYVDIIRYDLNGVLGEAEHNPILLNILTCSPFCATFTVPADVVCASETIYRVSADPLATCGPVTTYDCDTNGNCIPNATGTGTYANLSDCEANCNALTWNCTGGGGACVSVSDGSGTYSTLGECEDACGVAESYNCINGTCVDDGTGTGTYSNLFDCSFHCSDACCSTENPDLESATLCCTISNKTGSCTCFPDTLDFPPLGSGVWRGSLYDPSVCNWAERTGQNDGLFLLCTPIGFSMSCSGDVCLNGVGGNGGPPPHLVSATCEPFTVIFDVIFGLRPGVCTDEICDGTMRLTFTIGPC